jgi:ribosomal-protein-alanine N-acetyltransferase
MIRYDLPTVLRIEQASFPAPWDEPTFIHSLRTRNVIGMVAEHDDRAVGYMLYEMHNHRLVVLNFAVAAEYRRQGIGAAMVAKLRSKLTQDGRNRIVLEVSEANLPGQLFFKTQGFRAVSVIRDYYDNGQSAYQMVHRFGAQRVHPNIQVTEAHR